MPDSSLWNRYHQLLQDYIAHGDERQLREIVTLSQERGLALETTSGRVAASVRAVLSAYASIGAESMVVDVRRHVAGSQPRPAAAGGDGVGGEVPDRKCRVALSTPELGGDSVVIEIRGRCPDQNLPIVRLDYVNHLESDGHEEAVTPSLNRPIEPRQLYDVLMGLLAQDPS